MALATTCPRCQTGFRVVPDQLKIRRGLVRCGHCRHVFSGLDSLRYVNEAAAASPPPPATASTVPAVAAAPAESPSAALPEVSPARPEPAVRSQPAQPPDARKPDDEPPATLLIPEPLDEPVPAPRRASSTRDDIALEGLDELDDIGALSQAAADRRATVSRSSTSGSHPTDGKIELLLPDDDEADAPPGPRESPSPQPAEPAPDDPSAAWSAAVLAPGPEERRDDATGAAAEAVDFFAPPSRAGGFTSRGNAIAAVACGALGIVLAVQLAIVGRDWLAAHVPGVESALVSATQTLGVEVAPPRQLEALTLESFDVHAGTGPQALVLNALLRNQAPHRVRWPSMELTLTDGAGLVVVRKVLSPGDFLPAATIDAGVPPERELPLQVALETVGIQPSGYNVKLFYP